MRPFVDTYGYALLIMVMPRNCGPYPDYKMNTSSMVRWVMFPNPFDKPEYRFYKRPDLEFIKVIDDFMNFLRDNGYTPYPKVFMTGFSGGGQQSNRFPILHPSRIAATAVGGAGAFLYPVETWNRIPLTYPVGISDINRISGSTYSLAAFKQIPHFIFVGEKDLRYENDPVNFDDNYDRRQAYIINTYFGKNPVERSVKFADYLKSIGMQATLKIYPGVGHDYTHEMIRDTFNFFDSVPIE
jgi:dienelactone hydrolase